ncbi:fibrous sheath CABYR-binding protein-like [Tribolium madens]|uniref:fibrous sheath CABYR-binding protein-like n=1 Tax=Tribolium madens TaxID=41895 RepID=UPI001CF7389C|nr:fibrous sheath CABYR-binding protein-like [Tribolium madens]
MKTTAIIVLFVVLSATSGAPPVRYGTIIRENTLRHVLFGNLKPLIQGPLNIFFLVPEHLLSPFMNEKPGEFQKQLEEQPAEEKPAEEQPAEEQTKEEQPGENPPAEEQPAEEQPAEAPPAEEQPAEEQPKEEPPVEGQPGEESPAEQPVEEPNADEEAKQAEESSPDPNPVVD